MSHLRKIAWVGGYPAHYICELHRRLEKLFPERIRFFYVESSRGLRKQRKYEKGLLPDSYDIFDNCSKLRTLRIIKKIGDFDPGLIITAAHYPRPIWISAVIFILRKRKVCYWSDTNLQDIFLKPLWWQFTKKVIFDFYLRKMWRLMYIGSQNRDFYVWATDRLHFNSKGIFFPYPHNHSRYAEIFRRFQDKDKYPFTIISVGRLIANKRYDLLVESIALLPEDICKNVICHIAGDGPQKQSLIQKAKKLSVDNLINFVGAISSDQIIDFFQKGDVFVLPSDIEPWGIVVNEALSMGIPVVAPYWVGAVRDLVIDGVTGMSLPDNNPRTIAQAIVRLYRNRDYAKQLGMEGQKRVEVMGYDLERAVENFCELVNDFDAHQ